MIKRILSLVVLCIGLSYGMDSLIVVGTIFKDSNDVRVVDKLNSGSLVGISFYITIGTTRYCVLNISALGGRLSISQGNYRARSWRVQKIEPYSQVDPFIVETDVPYFYGSTIFRAPLCTLYQAGGPDKTIRCDVTKPHDSVVVNIPVYDIMTKQKMNDVTINSHYNNNGHSCDTSIVSSKNLKVANYGASTGYYVTATRDSFQSVSDTFFPYDSLWLARFTDTSWVNATSSHPYNQYTTDTLWMFRTIYPAPSIKPISLPISKQGSFVTVTYNIQGRMMQREKSGVMIQLMNGKVRRVVWLK